MGVCFSAPAFAYKNLACYTMGSDCEGSSTSSSSPSTATQVKINPSAVPTEKGLGLEGIFFKKEVDLALVRGNGKMGASISPGNSENTFFGAPAFETDENLLERKKYQEKYPNQKTTLAFAMNLMKPKGSGIKKRTLKLGIMGKHNKLTEKLSAGLGISGILGPLDFGYSIYDDESQISDDGIESVEKKYRVQTYNMGLHLSSLFLGYSHLHLATSDNSFKNNVSLFTANLKVGRLILTGSKRIEESPTLAYNYETRDLETKERKEENFGGLQYIASNNITVGLMHNYYLLREYSVIATFFF